MRPPVAAVQDAPDGVPFQERGWLDVNLGAAWSGDEGNAFTWLGVLYREPLARAAYYPSRQSERRSISTAA